MISIVVKTDFLTDPPPHPRLVQMFMGSNSFWWNLHRSGMGWPVVLWVGDDHVTLRSGKGLVGRFPLQETGNMLLLACT